MSEQHHSESLSSIVELLQKIIEHQKPCGVQINWSGDKLTWTLTASNITAEEWNPKPREQRLPHGIEVPEKPRLVSRRS